MDKGIDVDKGMDKDKTLLNRRGQRITLLSKGTADELAEVSES